MRILLHLILLMLPLATHAAAVRDTVYTQQGDKVILNYNVSADGDLLTIDMARPRVIPTEALRQACKGDLERIKVVMFDKVGSHGKVKWSGLTPSAFTVPPGFVYEPSADGYFIFGESAPFVITKKGADSKAISMPLYIAVWEKKQSYKIIGACARPLSVKMPAGSARSGRQNQPGVRSSHTGTETEEVVVQSIEEDDSENEYITKALSSISMIRRLMENETELPFSQTIIMEVTNLRSIQDHITDAEILAKINDVFLDFNDKERELKEASKDAALSAQAQEQAKIAEQQAAEEAKQKEAEEKARLQEEKQQKRSFWMIVGAVILGIIGFIANAVLKHFRDIRNQKSIMEMQESLAKQAEHEATRRTREIVRNKAHQAINKGRTKARQSFRDAGKNNKDKKDNDKNIRSI